MRWMKWGMMLLFLPGVLFGCQGANQAQSGDEFQNPENPYSPENAIENGDVVDLHGEFSNLDKFEQFINNVNNKKKDEIRITRYSIEGDPIFYNLLFDGKKIQYAYDNSQDFYGGQDKGIESTTCKNISSEEVDEGIQYFLKECDSNLDETFYFITPK